MAGNFGGPSMGSKNIGGWDDDPILPSANSNNSDPFAGISTVKPAGGPLNLNNFGG